MNLLITDMYLDTFRQLKRGNHKGVVSNAKPYLVLSILDAIEAKSVLNNRIYFEVLAPYYKKENTQFSPEIKPSPMSYPFYHLWTELFYHLQWRTTPQKKRRRLLNLSRIILSMHI